MEESIEIVNSFCFLSSVLTTNGTAPHFIPSSKYGDLTIFLKTLRSDYSMPTLIRWGLKPHFLNFMSTQILFVKGKLIGFDYSLQY